jgi:hypothetical protein
MADCKTLSHMINNLKTCSNLTNEKALIVFDAGIATSENKAMVVAKGYDYVCVSRTKPSNYKTKNEIPTIIYDSKNQKIAINEVEITTKKVVENQETK